jgi:hypothetical protein
MQLYVKIIRGHKDIKAREIIVLEAVLLPRRPSPTWRLLSSSYSAPYIRDQPLLRPRVIRCRRGRTTQAGGADVPTALGSWTDEAMDDADATPTYTTHAWRTGNEDGRCRRAELMPQLR